MSFFRHANKKEKMKIVKKKETRQMPLRRSRPRKVEGDWTSPSLQPPARHATMAIDGMYADPEESTMNADTGARRRSRRPLGAISANSILSPSRPPAAKAPQKAALEVPASPRIDLAPESSIFNSPIQCPIDDKERAQKRAHAARSSGAVPAAVAIGLVGVALFAAGPFISPATSPSTADVLQPAPTPSPQAGMLEATAIIPEGPIADFFHDDFASPVEIAAPAVDVPSAFEVVPAEPAAEEQPQEEEEATEPFATADDDDWAPLSVADLEFAQNFADAEPHEHGSASDVLSDDDTEKPWEAGIMSGPLHIPPSAEDDSTMSFAGFARLTEAGELYLFEEAHSDFPEGMLGIDGCTPVANAQNVCFPINTKSGHFMGCVGDWEEAADWVYSLRQIGCAQGV